MSIAGILEDARARGDLFLLQPLAPGATSKRRLYVPPELWLPLNGVDLTGEEIKWFASLRADLEVFVTGARIDRGYLKRLWRPSDGVWEIRSVRPRPQIRVLGAIPLKDWFVATNFANRDDLGDWGSREWRDVKVRSKAIRQTICLSYSMLSGSSINDYVSNAIAGNYFSDKPPVGVPTRLLPATPKK